MSEIIDQFYTPLLIEHGFIRDPDNQQYGALGDCWKLLPKLEKAPTGLMDRKTYTILKFTIFLSTRISCWNVLCQNV